MAEYCLNRLVRHAWCRCGTLVRTITGRVIACANLEKAGTLAHYDLADNLRGDFDGDGKPDYAILVISKDTKKRGIAVIKSLSAGVKV